MTAVYNEIEPFAARWLRGLITAGHIASGIVDERGISELAPTDVSGPGQRHFFAGIGGWSAALRLAGVRDDADIWTGSCPCQPFSEAGRRGGTSDIRHLWPAWFALIRECRPAVILGEQVASRAGLGWLDAVFDDLEGAGYACAAADLPAASVGAPHRRQRLFFVAYAEAGGVAYRERAGLEVVGEQQARGQLAAVERGGSACRVADAGQDEWGSAGTGKPKCEDQVIGCEGSVHDQPCGGDDRGMADTDHAGRGSRRASVGAEQPPGLGHAGWNHCDWIPCSDGVSRPVEPGTHPLSHGVRGRVGQLRGYGNAIVPQVAAAFIRAALNCEPRTTLPPRSRE